MSLNGWYQAELERQRREQIRLDMVRGQCQSLVASCQAAVTAVREPAVQQLAAKDLQRIQQKLQEVARQMGANPDQDHKQIKAVQKELHKAVGQAEAAAHKWNKQQAECRAQLGQAVQTVQGWDRNGGKANAALLEKAEKACAKATDLAQRGKYQDAIAVCNEVQDLSEQAASAVLDETVRREVVRGLLATLQGMGFVVDGPQIDRTAGEGGVVTLRGELPSGRMARFDVSIDGQTRFDLEGYEGRSCGKQLEQITETLRKQFFVKAGPPQITWKNPDKISKGARPVPATDRNRS